ncbi:MAG TPA: tetratricopeptide repeat protein [Pyrinomonadaceae bacterium]|nr:tetratricopeptide repeat protein [Pyrinomonadaceae bacterium]
MTIASNKLLLLPASLVFLLLVASLQFSVLAQTAEDQKNRELALQLYDQNKFTEAIPILEKLTKVYPNDSVLWERLGWASFVVSASLKDADARTKGRDRARAALLRAQELGDNSNLLKSGLEALSGPDPGELKFSNNPEADAAMREGEEAHSRGELDKAIASYQRALQLDPKLYNAALWTGDMYFKKGFQEKDTHARDELLNKAGEWFARAIGIDENVETAYRYWGDALMLQSRQTDAMMKFIDAIIAEPGNRNPYMGLTQWGQRTQTSMGHPQIEVPVKVSLTPDGTAHIDFDPALRASTDGSAAWESYGQVRSHWVAEDFRKNYASESVYRHSLREEVAALRQTAEAAAALLKTGKVKSLSPSLAALVKLNDADLLEPFVFFTRADQGITRDYVEFRRANREKLRRYWAEIVIAGK